MYLIIFELISVKTQTHFHFHFHFQSSKLQRKFRIQIPKIQKTKFIMEHYMLQLNEEHDPSVYSTFLYSCCTKKGSNPTSIYFPGKIILRHPVDFINVKTNFISILLLINYAQTTADKVCCETASNHVDTDTVKDVIIVQTVLIISSLVLTVTQSE